MSFKDHFSNHASDYARYRPLYPKSLFEYLSSLAKEHNTAWDCGTGNGQVALSLADCFHQVYASDASPQQIEQAMEHERIKYFVSSAESTQLPSVSVDLISVAQAFHWFDAERFYIEAKRVLKPEGILAIWCYDLFNLVDNSVQLERVLKHFYQRIESYWPPERQLVEDRYTTLSFPFAKIKAPRFSMTVEWDAGDLTGYLGTWSATQRFIANEGVDYVNQAFEDISTHWNTGERVRRRLQWSIYMHVGKLESNATKT
jgi:ubiquinone/menaquinone biosynthesis C-methylase UbiE